LGRKEAPTRRHRNRRGKAQGRGGLLPLREGKPRESTNMSSSSKNIEAVKTPLTPSRKKSPKNVRDNTNARMAGPQVVVLLGRGKHHGLLSKSDLKRWGGKT